ncbi:uncharacterized protein LOC135835609 [Planococcus citri]|uniref:uncharacterized protein LOC135835609 n=1 Tax=Planococcus citri TaxID=170843 RepID=UPI0031F96808
MSRLLLILIIKFTMLISRGDSGGPLHEFETTNILPLVLIRIGQNEFIHPTNLAISMTWRANFIFGTEFSASKKGDQSFFCGCEPKDENTITPTNKENVDLEDEYCTYELVKSKPKVENKIEHVEPESEVEHEPNEEPEPNEVKLEPKVEHEPNEEPEPNEVKLEPKVEHELELVKPEPEVEHELELVKPESEVEHESNKEHEPDEEPQFLKCTRDPEPFVKKLTETKPTGEETEVRCGSESDVKKTKGEMFAFMYNIKLNNGQTGNFEVFRFCYDVINRIVIFTDHVIRATALLNPDNLMFEYERSIEYKMSKKSFGNFGAEYETLEFAYTELKLEKEAKEYTDDTLEKSEITHKFLLSDQKLVPSDDMAFAQWRKTTDHFLNTMPMEDGKIELWNHISNIIRNDAINKSREYRIYTGTFDVSNDGKDDNEVIQSPDFWIKIVHYEWKDNGKEQNESIAVVMIHNPKLEDTKFLFKEFCKDKNYCAGKFKDKFPEYNESICCVHPVVVGSFFFNLQFHTHDVLNIEI